MVQTVKISGNTEDIFSCIDFYQNISVVGLQSIDDLRKVYIKMYLDDYKHRYAYRQRKKKAVSEEKAKVEKTVLLGKDTNSVEKVEGVVQPVEEVNNAPEESVNSNTYEREAYIARLWKEKYPIAEYVNRGTYIEDIVVKKQSVPAEVKDVEYVKNGVILEDFVVPSKVDVATVVKSVEAEPTKEPIVYVQRGVILEDVVAKVSTDSVSFASEEDVVKPKIKEKSEGKVEERYTEAPREHKPKRKKVATKKEPEKTEVYKSVRDYVKRNPGCVLNDLLGYFSQKEVQRALMAAKVVQRKKKFYVV